MGQLTRFRCASGRYRADVSGGPDAGMEIATETIVCTDCKRLMDVVAGRFGTEVDGESKHLPLRCKRRAKHRVKLWRRGDPCPKCGRAMDDDGSEIVVMWD